MAEGPAVGVVLKCHGIAGGPGERPHGVVEIGAVGGGVIRVSGRIDLAVHGQRGVETHQVVVVVDVAESTPAPVGDAGDVQVVVVVMESQMTVEVVLHGGEFVAIVMHAQGIAVAVDQVQQAGGIIGLARDVFKIERQAAFFADTVFTIGLVPGGDVNAFGIGQGGVGWYAAGHSCGLRGN